MALINKYIFSKLFLFVVGSTITLSLLIWLTQSLNFIKYIAKGGISFNTFIYFVFLLYPKFVTFILPLSVFFTVLYVYNKLLYDGELVVLRSCGVSPWQLCKPAINIALLFTVVCYFLSLYLQPYCLKVFKDLQQELRTESFNLILEEGAFKTVGNKYSGNTLTLFVDKKDRDGVLRGVIIHDDRDSNKQSVYFAEKGYVTKINEKLLLTLENGYKQEKNPKTNDIVTLKYSKNTINLNPFSYKTEERKNVKPSEYSTLDLFNLDTGIADYNKYIAEKHNRLLSPISVLTFVLCGLVFLIKNEFSRKGYLKRILSAIIFVISLQIIHMLFFNLVKGNVNFIPFFYLNHFLPIAICLYILSSDTNRLFKLFSFGQYKETRA